ncbi:peroxiredoxin family protein [Catenuloplanes atrovinosus]|uniref:Thiol-disulfide isomerase/thioredoxin n=1 Tax=Catenuloplanes atrovinosus TaxID=137266 RepID=A0AAE3YSB4_9ACTN|nr:TlpA disulfide reductase family protein [Catenuloplanes atrovinosus]MDR7276906.1 thiol-disulfide isomerase/thioredoxin [Catenuloplanes atrovinosus]
MHPSAPAWSTTRWFNSDPLTLGALRGHVVVLEAFQMLCPGCVSQGLPQASRLARVFGDDIRVIGLHSVFEHHAAMTPVSLEAFLHEYKISFPVGVDAHDGDDPTPVTFARYGMRGTPTTVLIDRDGAVRAHHFGAVDDLALGAAVARLVAAAPTPAPAPAVADEPSVCTIDGVCS